MDFKATASRGVLIAQFEEYFDDALLVVNAVIAAGASLTSIFISENTKETSAVADQFESRFSAVPSTDP